MKNKNIIFFDTLDSTNKFAKENIDNYPDKTIITAQTQTQGRGRLNRTWISEQGGLFFSLILKPNLNKTTNYSNLTQVMAISINETLKEFNVNSYIKWPNDIFIDNQKISGILSEIIFTNHKLNGIIIGVGINLNQEKEFSLKIDQEATSLFIQTGKKIKIDIFLEKLYNKFLINYKQFTIEGFKNLRENYLNSFPFIGKETEILLPNKVIKGTIVTISELGALVIIDNLNKTQHITMGDMIC